MNEIVNYLLIGIALSMDALTIATGLAVNNILTRNKKIYLIVLIGILHFIMPLFGSKLSVIIPFNIESLANYILAGIFLILGIEILFEKEEVEDKINFLYLSLISITVSIDSLTIGLGLSLIDGYNYIASTIFALTSSIFTLIGILLGKYINTYLKKYSNKIGSILLFLLALKYLFNI